MKIFNSLKNQLSSCGNNINQTNTLQIDDISFIYREFDSKYTNIIINLDLQNTFFIHELLTKSNSLLDENGNIIIYITNAKNSKTNIIKNFFKCIFPKTYLNILKILERKNIKLKNNLSLSEILGRLIYTGFNIEATKQIENINIITAKKSKEITKKEKFYGLIVALDRYGKNNKIIKVYKLRSMYPYSEYIQYYLQTQQGLGKLGKIDKDYRITKIGHFIRKYWIDEIPMFINFFKGDLKLYGVRPLSKVAFDLRPKYLQELRYKVKPGLIPPIGKDIDDVINKEIIYIKEYLNSPIKTDFQYLLKTFKIIFIHGQRSK